MKNCIQQTIKKRLHWITSKKFWIEMSTESHVIELPALRSLSPFFSGGEIQRPFNVSALSMPERSSSCYPWNCRKKKGDKCSKCLWSPHSTETDCKRCHHGVLSCFLFFPWGLPAACCLASSLIRSNCNFVCQRLFTKSRRKSARLRGTRSSIEKLVKISFVNSSASWFSSRGLHLKSSVSLDLAKHDDNSMLTNINGHFVVERLLDNRSFAWFSVPAKMENCIVRLVLPPSSQPNALRAANDASSSAEVDAHCAPPPSGLNRNGTCSLERDIENHLRVQTSQPPNTTVVSVHLASVRNCSSTNTLGLCAETINDSFDSSICMYFKVKMTVSGNLPTSPEDATALHAKRGERCGFNQTKSWDTNPSLPRNSLKSRAATTNFLFSRLWIQSTNQDPLWVVMPTSFLS